MKSRPKRWRPWFLALLTVCIAAGVQAADEKKPNILFIVSDDTGYGDLGPYGGGVGRGMPTPNIDRLAKDGLQFWSFYAQPDPQERYDIFMNNYTEHTWTLVTISQSIERLMKTYVQYPPRKMQSMGYDGPVELSKYQKFQWLRDQLGKEGVNIPLPTGN